MDLAWVLLFTLIFGLKDCMGLFVRWEQRPTCTRGHDHIPDQYSCHHFYHCWGFRLTHKYCGPYLMFNPVTKVCDWPTIVISIRPMCADPGHVSNNPFFDSHNMILKRKKIVEKRSTTTPITTTVTTTTTTRRPTTTSSTTTTRGTTSTTWPPSTVAVKGFHLFKTTKVPKKVFPKKFQDNFYQTSDHYQCTVQALQT